MISHRYSLRTLLVSIAVVAAYFPLARIYHSWFTTRHGGYYVASVLGSQIHNGDSVSDVAMHFESHCLLSDTDEHHMQNIAEIWGGFNFPIEPEDEFFYFSIPGNGAYLQFRDDRLVNLPNSVYSDARKIAQSNNYSLPHPMLVFGFLPFYLIFVVCVMFLYAWLHRRRRSDDGRSLADGLKSA